jgi:hypothetical protein|tara:strand:+ start:347 stop:532 length:186 start_codon:yes stop_codon:yes gene_type:complete
MAAQQAILALGRDARDFELAPKLTLASAESYHSTTLQFGKQHCVGELVCAGYRPRENRMNP